MPDEIVAIEQPLVVMLEAGGAVVCQIFPNARAASHREYGLLICDLVRHVARAFEVEEDDVWEWVHKERRHPTTVIDRPS
jgi:hypothetical protein